MGFQPLPYFNGRCHLPLPRGKYIVGTTDIMTKNNLFVRCFYPTKLSQSSQDHLSESTSWPLWLPSLEYAEGYLSFKFSGRRPLLARFFRFMLRNPYCPIKENGNVCNIGRPLPVIVFSHGMGAMRTTYSLLLTELASHGHFVAAVEHRDGSGAATYNVDGSWTFERKIQPDEDEYQIRNGQVNQRVGECEKVYHLLCNLSRGGAEEEKTDEFELHQPLPSQGFLDSLKLAQLNLSEGCYISGHSFGGATALKSIFSSKLTNGKHMFKKALLYDTWMYPLRNEAEELVKSAPPERSKDVVFVNCERFQSAKNIATMRHFETSGNILTLRDAQHYAPCDIPTVSMGSWLRIPFSWLFRMANNQYQCENGEPLPAHKALDVCTDLGVRYFEGGSNGEEDPFRAYLNSIDRYVIHGTGYMS